MELKLEKLYRRDYVKTEAGALTVTWAGAEKRQRNLYKIQELHLPHLKKFLVGIGYEIVYQGLLGFAQVQKFNARFAGRNGPSLDPGPGIDPRDPSARIDDPIVGQPYLQLQRVSGGDPRMQVQTDPARGQVSCPA